MFHRRRLSTYRRPPIARRYLATEASRPGLTIRAGMKNLFDSLSHFSYVAGAAGYDPSLGELRGRFTYLSLTKSF